MRFITLGEKLGRPECPYMERWAINFGIISFRVHHWISSDDGRNFHDHPWGFITIVLKGSYTDINENGCELMRPGMIRFRPALHKHTVKVCPEGCWTFIITGRVVRRWGFWVKGKFKRSNKYFLEHGHHVCN